MSAPVEVRMRIGIALALAAALGPASFSLADDQQSPAPPGPWQDPPRLGRPGGRLVRVHSEAQLQNAVHGLRSGTTILIEPGIYRLTNTIHLTGGVKQVTIRGASDDRAAVVLKGPGMRRRDHGDVPHGIMVSDATDVLIANLSVGDVWYHPITLQGQAGCKRVRIFNVRLFDAGEQFLKANPDNRGGGVDNCTVEYCVFEYTDRARHNYTQGMSVHTAANWTVRNNLFRNIRGPKEDPRVGGCIDFWHGSRNATVEGNVIVNCRMGIRLGIVDRMKEQGVHDNEGGIIRNNVIWRQPGAVEAPDGGILVGDSPRSKVLHNTVLLNGTFPPGVIEYRWSDGIVVANNLADGSIWKREDANGLEDNNVITTDRGIFVNAAAGDLRLAPKARMALPRVTALADCQTDIWGRKRNEKTAVGAEEFPNLGPKPRP
jgi:Right handed beta helix region